MDLTGPFFFRVGALAKTNLVLKLEEILKPICENMGLKLYDLSFEAGGRNLRVFIDQPDQDKSIQVEDCEKVSRAFSQILDEDENLIPGNDYTLEVSSPGVERRLTQIWHYKNVLDKKVEVKFFEAVGKMAPEVPKKCQRAKTVQGILKDASEEDFSLELDGNSFRFRYDKVVKANVVFEF